jgi:hypothetical protein
MLMKSSLAVGRIQLACAVFCVLWLTACDPFEAQHAEQVEKTRIECLDKICPGDVEPKRDYAKDALLKLNGQWYLGPKEYFSGGHGAVFYWPSKTPETGRSDGQSYPERGQDFNEVAIEIFLRSNNIPSEPRGYKLIELAESKGWIADRRTLRRGLDAIKMKHVIGPRGQYIDHVTYYVATQLKGTDGLPPVATCGHVNPSDSGGAGFMWQPGIWAGTRMNQKHCADWPEIFQEITRVLQLLKKA